MNRIVRKLLGIAAGVALFVITASVLVVVRMGSQVRDFDTTPVDISEVADGVYEGHSETVLVKVDVRVTVKAGAIADIEILRHECGRGRPAENMIPSMIRQNDVEVDAVSGATYSGAVIKDAVRNALRAGHS